MGKLTKEERRKIRFDIVEEATQKIAKLAIKDPDWQSRIEERKTKIAIGKLGIEKLIAEKIALQSKIDELEAALRIVEKKITEKMPFEQSRYKDACATRVSMCTAISQIKDAINLKCMQEDKTGSAILAIYDERDDRLKKLAGSLTYEELISKRVV